jgi:hypothetical protein
MATKQVGRPHVRTADQKVSCPAAKKDALGMDKKTPVNKEEVGALLRVSLPKLATDFAATSKPYCHLRSMSNIA